MDLLFSTESVVNELNRSDSASIETVEEKEGKTDDEQPSAFKFKGSNVRSSSQTPLMSKRGGIKRAYSDPAESVRSRGRARILSPDLSSSDEENQTVIPQVIKQPSLQKKISKSKYDHTPTSRSHKFAGATPNKSRNTFSSQQNACGEQILNVLSDISNSLRTLGERVENTEKELKTIKKKLCTPSSSCDSSSTSKERVPLVVRSETRKTYKTMMDEDTDFEGFVIGPSVTFKTPVNQSVVAKLIKEVQGTNRAFQACHIRAAAYTYYKTLTQQESLQRRGKANDRNKIRRRHERMMRKLQDRPAMFEKYTYSESDTKKLRKVLINEFQSSEESGEDDVVIVKPLPWRSEIVNTFFASLDDKIMEDRSPQARRQLKSKVIGSPSTRPLPFGESLPSWAKN